MKFKCVVCEFEFDVDADVNEDGDVEFAGGEDACPKCGCDSDPMD